MNISGPSSAMNSGVLGFQRASQQVDQSAQDLARAGTTTSTEVDVVVLARAGTTTSTSVETPRPVDTTSALVSLKSGEQAGMTSAKVVKTADEMMGTLLDIHV